MGTKGLVWSASAMGVLLNEGIGDTIRVSLTPRPGGDRREEVYAACELLQALGLRVVLAERHRVPGLRPHHQHARSRSWPSGCRATSASGCPSGRRRYEGVETMTLAVMGCVVNGPGRIEGGQHRHQPARHRRSAELPRSSSTASTSPTLRGTYDELAAEFQRLVDDYVEQSTQTLTRQLCPARSIPR